MLGKIIEGQHLCQGCKNIYIMQKQVLCIDCKAKQIKKAQNKILNPMYSKIKKKKKTNNFIDDMIKKSNGFLTLEDLKLLHAKSGNVWLTINDSV
jgi:hypothetical protein